MAETAIIMDEEQPEERGPLDIREIIAMDNVAELLDDSQLSAIGAECLHGYEIDEKSREEWLVKYKRYLDVAMQVKEAKNFPWPKAANIKYPLLTTAAVQFQARAYPAIVDGQQLVKAKVMGPDPVGEKRSRADRVANHMSWQLLYDMPDWEEETDRLLLMLPIVGCVFRKTYYDEVAGHNCSIMVPADDFVVNYWARSLETTPRYTHIVRLYPNDVRERVLVGRWIDPGDVAPTPDSKRVDQSDDNAEIEFLEQHCLIDLDEDGYAEPYIVTLTREGKVVRITASYTPDEVTMNERGVVRIDRRCWFVKYGFIPSPDGSFYEMGFGQLLDDISSTIDAIINQSLDAGALQNAQGGFLGSGVNIKGGPLRIALGEWKRVDVTTGTLRDNILPLNLPGPSAVLLNLLNVLLEAGKGITSVQDILTGEAQGANASPTTTLAQIEQGMKVMTAIFKRIHRSFRKELKNLFILNGENMDEEAYFNLNDDPQMVAQADYQDKDLDVMPVSDPTMVSDAQKLGRAGFLLQSFKGDPGINQMELNQRAIEAAGIPDVQKLLVPPPDTPPPELVMALEEKANERMKTKADVRAKDAAAAASLMASAVSAAQLGMDASIFTGAATKLAIDSAKEGMDEPADGPGGIPEMEEPQADEALSPVPEGPAIGPDGGMGPGADIGPGIPADGEVVGGVGGPAMQ